MLKNDNNYFLKLFAYCFVGTIFIEIIFKIMAFNSLFEKELVRIFLFSLTTSGLIAFIAALFKPKVSKIIISSYLFVIGFYAIVQLVFNSYSSFISFNMIGGGELGRFSTEVVNFIKYHLSFSYFVMLLPFVVGVVLFIWKKQWFKYEKINLRQSLGIGLLVVILQACSLLTLEVKFLNNDNQIKNNKELYYNPSIVDLSIRQFGVSRFLWRDTMSLFIPAQDNLIDVEITEPVVVIPDYERYIDDKNWLQMIENENDKVIKNLHEYFINQTITPKNEMTGIFKDKNLIYIMVEALDFAAIDSQLTPTLYKLYTEGWYFDNYYAPKYSCTTGESEFIGLTSIIPSISSCTPYTYVDNDYSTSIFNLFKDMGYDVTSYHNWKDQFYPRKQLHGNMGSNYYYDKSDLNIKSGTGWPSDFNLMEEAYPIFSQKEKYMSFIITSSMHFPYDEDSRVVYENWDKVKNLNVNILMKRYLAKVIDFDKGLEYLLKSLEMDGTLDDTVIVLFADHHPFNISLSYLDERSSIDRMVDLNEDRSPFIIYSSSAERLVIEKTASTFDILPTLANLFDLDYDPRYYVGTDIFSDQETIVLFPNGNWITDKAIYFASKGTFKILDDSIDENYIKKMTKIASDKFTAYDNVLEKDYFKYRFNK